MDNFRLRRKFPIIITGTFYRNYSLFFIHYSLFIIHYPKLIPANNLTYLEYQHS